jgi:hypothetical protein
MSIQIPAQDVLYGSLSLIMVIISFVVGLRIVSKYFKTRQVTLVTVGLSWIFITSAWWVSAFTFVLAALFEFQFNAFWYLFLENAFSPVALVLWIYSFVEMIYPERKGVFRVYALICTAFEVALVATLIVSPELIGTGIEEGIFSSRLTPFAVGFQLFGLATLVVTGIIFSIKTMRAPRKEAREREKMRWKGRFLLLAFVSFAAASLAEALFLLDPAGLLVVRTILIASNLEFYLGFFLPDWLAKGLLGEGD